MHSAVKVIDAVCSFKKRSASVQAGVDTSGFSSPVSNLF